MPYEQKRFILLLLIWSCVGRNANLRFIAEVVKLFTCVYGVWYYLYIVAIDDYIITKYHFILCDVINGWHLLRVRRIELQIE